VRIAVCSRDVAATVAPMWSMLTASRSIWSGHTDPSRKRSPQWAPTTEHRTRPGTPRAGSKEAAGSITGNDDLRNKGKVDQAKAELKNAGEDLKGAAGKVKDTLT
jgi:uncharacterized protein YjbJ (UPF0337 family)